MNTSHRAMVILHRLTKTDHTVLVDHDNKMALVWRFMKEQWFPHREAEKPYCWDLSTNDGEYYNLTFSCITPEVTGWFLQAAKKCEGTCLNVGTEFWQVEKVMPVQDLPFIANYLRLSSMNGLQCFTMKRVNETKKCRVLIHAGEDPERFITSIKTRLIRRTKEFMDVDIPEDAVKIQHLNTMAGIISIPYKHSRIRTQQVTFKLVAPKEVLEMALYGGIGKETGSGFGFMLAS